MVDVDSPQRGWPQGIGQTRFAGPDGWRWWKPVLLFVTVVVVVWVVVLVVGASAPREYLYPNLGDLRGGPLVERWVRWDSSWYREIVRHGYVYFPGIQSSVAFFPSYPIILWAITLLGIEPFTAGVVVTVVSGLGAAVLFHRWCWDRMSPAAATTSLLVLLVYPYAFYLYGAVYSDAFFLVAVLAAFVLVERDRYVLAAVAGFVAAAGRPTGIAVPIALVLLVIERANRASLTEEGDPPSSLRHDTGRLSGFVVELRRRFDPRGFPARAWPVLASFAGLGAWMAYLWARFGDPLLFLHVESAWHQGAGPATWLKFSFFGELHNVGTSIFSTGLLLHAVAGLGALALVPWVGRRFGWAYAAYVLVVVGMPVIGTKDFMSTGRYVLAAFPCFALVGAWLVERHPARGRITWLGFSGALMLVLASLWTVGKYIA